ncbi:MAG: hypothetical protein M5U09_26155 [Gammaproteobacteria bacterium]|nr:hypothetical protein [Gammaproteobacteria bacterium]
MVPVCGWLAGDGEAVSRIEVEVDGHPAPSLDLDEPLPRGLWPARAAEVPGSARGFAGDLVLPAREPGFTHAVKLTALTRRHDQRLSKVQPVERAALPPVQPATRGLSPRIAICMAVFNPRSARLCRTGRLDHRAGARGLDLHRQRRRIER